METCTAESDLEYVMIDSTILRAHPCAAGYKKGEQESEGLGRSCGGFSTKVHAKVDALGNPLKLIITEGKTHDGKVANELLKENHDCKILADRGYDSNDLIIEGLLKGCEMVIPPKKNRNLQRKYDEHIYKDRHLVECFFNKIKHFRRIFSRFDKSLKSFMGFLSFACAHVWLR